MAKRIKAQIFHHLSLLSEMPTRLLDQHVHCWLGSNSGCTICNDKGVLDKETLDTCHLLEPAFACFASFVCPYIGCQLKLHRSPCCLPSRESPESASLVCVGDVKVSVRFHLTIQYHTSSVHLRPVSNSVGSWDNGLTTDRSTTKAFLVLFQY